MCVGAIAGRVLLPGRDADTDDLVLSHGFVVVCFLYNFRFKIISALYSFTVHLQGGAMCFSQHVLSCMWVFSLEI